MNMPYTIDLDIIKDIFTCPGVASVKWRVSASGKGFHFLWYCDSRPCSTCHTCLTTMKQFDDPRRLTRDRQRESHQRRVLWGIKGGRKAGRWHIVKRGNVTKGLTPKKH